MDDEQSDGGDSERNVSVDLSPDSDGDNDEGGFDHPDDDEIEVVDADDIPEVNSVEDAVDGDMDRADALIDAGQRLKEKASDGGQATAEEEMGERLSEKDRAARADESVSEDTGDDSEDGEDEAEGQPVRLGDDVSVEKSGSVFSADEAEEVEEEFGGFELKPLDDVPDDFDYDAQDTTDFGVDDREIDIEHNGVIFHLEQPEGMREDKFWGEIQTNQSLASMFDAMIRYTVTKPEDIDERMDAENWTSFAKAGLAMKCSAFLGLDALQDF